MKKQLAVALLLVAGAAAVARSGRPSIGADQFPRLHALVQPGEGETKYLDELSWAPTLWDARKRAAAEGLPLFIMATDGDPLGLC
jgi:hypothetical protein